MLQKYHGISVSFQDSCSLIENTPEFSVSKFYLQVHIMQNLVAVQFGAVFLCLPACCIVDLAFCHPSSHLGMHSKDHGVFFFRSLCQQTFITAYTLPDTTLNSEDECNRPMLQRDLQCSRNVRTRKERGLKDPFIKQMFSKHLLCAKQSHAPRKPPSLERTKCLLIMEFAFSQNEQTTENK